MLARKWRAAERRRLQRRTAVVIGAASGIGRGLLARRRPESYQKRLASRLRA
ncbi:hypothetical protein KH5H1_32460 [Corallococcus caeni]|nr:hypothetical protein KH5H1_32460 [Corallococcus sp. KH5-1]